MSELLKEFLDILDEKRKVVNYIKVVQNGETVAEYSRLLTKTRFNIMSASKSFVGVAAGIAMDEGLLSLDDKMCDCFPEYVPDDANENLLAVTARDLITMTAGNDEALFFNDDPERYTTYDWIEYFFRQKFTHKPGERFLYSNFNTYMLSCMIEKKTGENLCRWLTPRLFEPLGIRYPDWTSCPTGHCHAANGLYLTVDEFARFGDMLLHNGVYGGKQLVSADFLKEASRIHVDTGDGRRYGYQFWIHPKGHAWWASGRLGHHCIILPEKNAVVTTMGCDSDGFFEETWKLIAKKL